MQKTQQTQRSLNISLAQLNFCVGDISGNSAQISRAIQQALEQQADIILFPELSLSAYAQEDMVLRDDFLQQIERAFQTLLPLVQGITAIIGLPLKQEGHLYNAACVVQDGQCVGTYFKQCLPNYRVFDEQRWFSSDKKSLVVPINGVNCGILICEDIWHADPAQQAVAAGAEVLLVLNASPYRHNKLQSRLDVLQQQARMHHCALAYANLVGGQDELVFDGDSLLLDAQGAIVLQAPLFEAGVFTAQLPVPSSRLTDQPAHRTTPPVSVSIPTPLLRTSQPEHIYQALVLGVRDYVHKNGFQQVLLGLSGGIDSALTLAIAVDALGAEYVTAVMMPFHYTAAISVEDARAQANKMGVNFQEIPIEPIFNAFQASLQPVFQGQPADVTEENLQARIRGMLLMSMANKFNQLLLATSNKSESAMGYATLYGDMAGAFAPLKDVYKTTVYELARYRNQQDVVIPERVIERPPSAELAPGQLDQDSLPEYAQLDDILRRFMEQGESLNAMIASGMEIQTVQQVINLLLLNEYKRRQAAPGVRITSRAFGRDWRYPVTSRWRQQLPLGEES